MNKQSLICEYLLYLRDISRKLIQRNGYESIIGRSRKKAIYDLTEGLSRQDVSILNMAEQKPDTKLFVGLCFIVGKIKKKDGAEKKISGPLIMALVDELDYDEKIKFTIEWDSLTLNYDLIASILGIEEGSREEDDTPDEVGQRILLTLKDIDEKIFGYTNKEWNDLLQGGDEKRKEVAKDIFGLLLTHFPNIKLNIQEEKFKFSRLDSIFEEKNAIHLFPNSFIFPGKYPDELSNYIALQKLVKLIQNDGLQNPLITKLISSALLGEKIVLKEDLAPEKVVNNAIKYLPLSLTKVQKDAIKSAWMKEVSYIQGPPGTGKSFTISAILLSAIYLKKTVLLVSQKKAAIDVVKNIVSTMSGDPNACVYLGKRRMENNPLVSHINELLESTTREYRQRIPSLYDFEIEKSKETIDSLREDLKFNFKQLRASITLERQFVEAIEHFAKLKKEFIELFNTPLREEQFSEADMLNYEKLHASYERIQEIMTNAKDKRAIMIRDALYTQRTLKSMVKYLEAKREFLSIRGINTLAYLKKLIEAFSNIRVINSYRKQLSSTEDLETFRRFLLTKITSLQSQQRKFLALSIQKRKKDAILDPSIRESAKEFQKVLNSTDANRVQDRMVDVNYGDVTKLLPIWTGLIRDLGKYVKFDSELFDLVIVDEASQVNIAEILPAFYRGKRICVVGDSEQLGLNAAGLFMINKNFEELVWQKNMSPVCDIRMNQAEERALVVSKNSILDFIINPNNGLSSEKAVLNEHFRSMPKLAQFTSEIFYSGNLRVMTQVGENVVLECFQAICTGGIRMEKQRVVKEEIEMLFELLVDLIKNESWRTDKKLSPHFMTKPSHFVPSIGILTFTTDACNAILNRLKEVFPDDEERESYKLFVGTTEEFQGNERNIMFLLPASDNMLTKSAHFYNNKNRFNVATSRAINFTYLIYGGLPPNFLLFQNLLNKLSTDHNATVSKETFLESYYAWSLNKNAFDSEFEGHFFEYLFGFIKTGYSKNALKIFNQVPSCGKFLDFVVMNVDSGKCFAIEVDGKQHYRSDNQLSYTDEHIQREEILRRAGWQILHVPYYKWYSGGWLDIGDNPLFKEFTTDLNEKLQTEIAKIL